MKKLLAFCLTFLIWLPASSQADGRTLLKECGELLHFADTGTLDNTGTGASYCMGMVNGMMSLNAVYRSRPDATALFCPPAGKITNARGARLVVEYLQRNQDQLQLDAGSLMLFAFREAFPCPTN
jgi:Rap1a immunity proteins